MTDKELFGISEQLDCSDCVNHGGDWDCDHVQCHKGTDIISRQAALDAIKKLEKPAPTAQHLSAIFDCEDTIKALPPAKPSVSKTEIVGDVISRQVAIKAICEDGTRLERKGQYTMTMAERKQRDADILDALPYALPYAQPDIVACGDCIHWICHDRRCGYWNHGVKPLDWCCHAERRSDG